MPKHLEKYLFDTLAAAAESGEIGWQMKGRTSRRKLLIVDDQPTMRSLVRRICSEPSDEVIECANGLEACSVYRSDRPDWVIMDIMMPVLDGLQAAARITSEYPEARILIVSQQNETSFQQGATAAGAMAFFNKDDLMKVREYMNQAREKL